MVSLIPPPLRGGFVFDSFHGLRDAFGIASWLSLAPSGRGRWEEWCGEGDFGGGEEGWGGGEGGPPLESSRRDACFMSAPAEVVAAASHPA